VNRIPELSVEQFAPWEIILPDHTIRDQEPGSIQAQGWRIRYRFRADGRGAYLNYYGLASNGGRSPRSDLRLG
jgi:hypothetical protein